MKSKDVILVGIRSETCGLGFLSTLQADGFNLTESPAPENLPGILQDHPGATIVVYNKSREDTARRVLATVSAATRHIPVIVLVDIGTFEEYYDFMCQGAYDYFELGEDPVAVERAIRYAPEAPAKPAVCVAVA
jgi:DNA-binding NtrC family response regulator